jgi:microcystin-dependent protein
VSEPFLAEIRAFAFGYVPRGWAECGGQLLPINQNQALFSLLGTTYGGDGRTTFALPDLRGRTAVGVGADVSHGARGGEEAHTLTRAETDHSHLAAAPATTSTPQGGATPAIGGAYADSRDDGIVAGGASQPHENRAPYLAMTWAIALQGIFPSRD